MKLTPSQVKNLMRRGLRLLVDPDPDPEERKDLYQFFRNKCAFCGVSVENGSGDLDHLIPASKGGSNHLSNRVLSCKPCNAEHRRDKDWEQYLKSICRNQRTYLSRWRRIDTWMKRCGGPKCLPSRVLSVIEKECARSTAYYDRACRRVRGV
jgi:HNH endonuclease